MTFTAQQTTRAQARLAAVEPLIANVGSLYELVATGTVTDPEVIAVFTTVIADQKATITAYLAALTATGDPKPLDQAAATVGRLRIEQAKGVLSHLQRALPALSAPIAANEDGDTIAQITTGQRSAIATDIDRAVAKLTATITST
jgi:hypothetical protein